MKKVYVDDVLKVLHEYGEFIFNTDSKKYSNMVNTISNLPSAENLVVEYDFKGKTNGEVIKAVFPNFHTDEMSHTVWVGYDAMSFHRDWWDSPYEPQERSE